MFSILAFRGKWLAKKTDAEFMRKYTTSTFILYIPDNYKWSKSWTNFAGSQQKAMADKWHKKFSNINVTMHNVNISVLRVSKLGILCLQFATCKKNMEEQAVFH